MNTGNLFWVYRFQPFNVETISFLLIYIFWSYLSWSLADRWGTTVNFTTSFLHASRFSAFHSSIFHSRPVHSLMLSSHHFLCLPHIYTVFNLQSLSLHCSKGIFPSHILCSEFEVDNTYGMELSRILQSTQRLTYWELWLFVRFCVSTSKLTSHWQHSMKPTSAQTMKQLVVGVRRPVNLYSYLRQRNKK